MEAKLLRYIELLIKIYESVEDPKKLTESVSVEFNNILKYLIEFLISNPGGLIFIENKEKIKACKFAVEKVFKFYTPNEIYEEILDGGFGGLMFDELRAYTYRVRKLIPTFVSIKFENNEFNVYYNEAMKCWLYGLCNSSIIIIATYLENILKDKLISISKMELHDRNNFENIINIAEYNRLISNKSKLSAHNLRGKRNMIVHHGYKISSDNALELIKETKDIVEELFN